MSSQPTLAEVEHAAGDLVGDCYRLRAPIGEGATGMVWSAEHVPTGDLVAIKVLRPELARTEAVGRFAREARLAGQLLSPHIVRVEDEGFCADGRPFVVMELLEGELLSGRLRREARLSLAATLPIVQQLADALEVAHRQKIAHRDLKPENVFLERLTGAGVRVMLMDFGIAKEFDTVEPPPSSAAPPSQVALQRQLTRLGDVVGTPAYMSPEQATAKPIDHRTDLWALGATVYRLLVGETPFGSGPQATVAYRIMTATPRPPSELVPELPEAIDAWVAKALAKDPRDRFQSARAMTDALAQVAMSSTTRARPPPNALTPDVSLVRPVSIADGDDVPQPPRPSLRLPLMIAGAIVVLVVLLRLILG